MRQAEGKGKLNPERPAVPPDAAHASAAPAGFSPLRDLTMALRFFSRLPSGAAPHEVPDLTRIARVLPIASLLIGVLPALALYGLGLADLPALFAAIVACALFAIVTGAMSEDALADAADGLFGGTTPERRLVILKDSLHGSYGVLAIVFLVLLRVAALAAMLQVSPLAAALCWLAATVFARSAALYPAHALPPARSDGAAAGARPLRRNGLVVGLVFAAVLATILAYGFVGWPGIVVGGVVTGVLAFGWTRLCDRMVGGITGDLIGALQALIEIGLLTTFMVFIR